MSFAAFAISDQTAIDKRVTALFARVSEETITDEQKKSILNNINKTQSNANPVEGAEHMKITKEMVLAEASEVAELFRAEGAKSVTVTAEMVPESIAQALKDEGAKSVDVETVKAQAIADERKRIADLQALAVNGSAEIIAKAIADGSQASEVAIAILTGAKASGTDIIAGLKNAEANLPLIPANTSAGGTVTMSEDQKVQAQVAKDVASARELGIIQ
jgi:hypothetical protein